MRMAIVGNINLDINARIGSSENREEERVKNLLITPGGTAANTAIQLARLGNEVVLYGNVGRDMFGEYLLKILSNEGVDISGIRSVNDSGTGTCFVSIPDSGDRHLYTYRGANEQELTGEKSAITHLAGVTPAQVEKWIGDGLADYLSYVPGGIVTFEYPEEILEISGELDLLVLNESEYSFLSKHGNPQSRSVVVTEGEKGSRLEGKGLKADGYRVTQIDSTGAGDAFIAGFFHAYLRNTPFENCLKMGNLMGAMTVSKRGATGKIEISEIRDFVRKNEPTLMYLFQ